MRCSLWSDHTAVEHEVEMCAWVKRSDTAVFVCGQETGRLCGFAEVSVRSYADGCKSTPVAFLEGWYVDGPFRGRGVGRALVEAVEAWARDKGFRELASDTLLDNELGQRAHEHLGFVEVERAVRYRKWIVESAV